MSRLVHVHVSTIVGQPSTVPRHVRPMSYSLFHFPWLRDTEVVRHLFGTPSAEQKKFNVVMATPLTCVESGEWADGRSLHVRCNGGCDCARGGKGMGLWVTPKAVPEYWGSLLTWVFQLIVSMVAVFWVGFLGISTPHCAPNCQWDLLGYNFQGFMIATALIQLVSIVLMVVLRRRPKVWVVPVAGIALTVVLCVISSFIAYKAMLFF